MPLRVCGRAIQAVRTDSCQTHLPSDETRGSPVRIGFRVQFPVELAPRQGRLRSPRRGRIATIRSACGSRRTASIGGSDGAGAWRHRQEPTETPETSSSPVPADGTAVKREGAKRENGCGKHAMGPYVASLAWIISWPVRRSVTSFLRATFDPPRSRAIATNQRRPLFQFEVSGFILKDRSSRTRWIRPRLWLAVSTDRQMCRLWSSSELDLADDLASEL